MGRLVASGESKKVTTNVHLATKIGPPDTRCDLNEMYMYKLNHRVTAGFRLHQGV
jgi:hypothetical protein